MNQELSVRSTHDENDIRKMSLHEKIVAIMGEVQYIQKDMRVSFQRTNYSALSETKVTSVIRNQLIKYGLTMIPVYQEYQRIVEKDITVLNVTYRLTDSNSGEYIDVVSTGEGRDTQDKGAGKASTYAFKYALLRLFNIPTGDDPDIISSDEHDHNIKEEDKAKREGLIGYITWAYQKEFNETGVMNEASSVTQSVVGSNVNDFSALSTEQLDAICVGLSQLPRFATT